MSSTYWDQVLQRRLSRRRTLATVATAASAAVILSCGGSKNDQKGIWLINETNGAITQMLTGSIGSYASYSYLDWSPDGTQLTYTFTPDRRASW